MEKITLTKAGEENLRRQIEEKKAELHRLGIYKGSAAENEGDAWHDNFAFEQTEIKERGLIHEISELERKLSIAEIVNVKEVNKNVATIGSKVTVNMKFNDEESEEITFLLVGDFEGETSINSPMGKCINGKQVGFKGKYKINENIVSVELLKIE